MGSVLSHCMSARTRTAVADAIPDRDVLMSIANSIANFEESLKEVRAEVRASNGI